MYTNQFSTQIDKGVLSEKLGGKRVMIYRGGSWRTQLNSYSNDKELDKRTEAGIKLWQHHEGASVSMMHLDNRHSNVISG